MDRNVKKIKVSVMMLAYNCEAYLEKAINSILEQSFENWELIIIDDHSTDNTASVAKGYAERDHRIKYFRNEKNLGIPKSRNKALRKSNGKYIAILDSDDIWSDYEKLKRQVSFLDNHRNYGVVGSWAIFINQNGEILKKVERPTSDEEIRGQILFGNPIINSTTLIRKQAITDVGGYDNNFSTSEDYDLWLKIGKEWKLSNLNEYTVRYRFHGSNTSFSERKQLLELDYLTVKTNGSTYPNYWPALIKKKIKLFFRPFLLPLWRYMQKLIKVNQRK